MRLRTLCVALAAGSALTACSTESLGVTELDRPDVERSLSTPDGIEAILKNGFVQIYGATTGSGTITPAAEVLAYESYGSVANFGMNLRAAIPRVQIDNNKGNATATENFASFQALSLRARTLGNAIRALNTLIDESGGSLGSPARNLRGKAFGFFALGLANGELALAYDSAGIVTTSLATSDVPELTGYNESVAIALAQIDSAIMYTTQAQTATGSDGFPLPVDWLRLTSAPTSAADFLKILHSLKARLRAGVARTPAERAAVNWTEVVNDAVAGITSDVVLDLDSGLGWGNGWLSQLAVYQGWHNMPYFIIGMADTTSGYATWLGTPLDSRTSFLIRTPDTRFPAGATRAAQFTASPAGTDQLPSVYFRNRVPGEDTPGQPYGDSYYDFVRFRSYRQDNGKGPWIWMSATENAMLRAEGLIALNRAAEAVPLVNASRAAHGLPAYASATGRAPTPGGATSCVPRTPTGAGGALVCGTLFEGLKWEKRMETAITGYIQWYIDGRGWGDLLAGTPLDWPVPFQELDARRKTAYPSQQASAGSTYNFF